MWECAVGVYGIYLFTKRKHGKTKNQTNRKVKAIAKGKERWGGRFAGCCF